MEDSLNLNLVKLGKTLRTTCSGHEHLTKAHQGGVANNFMPHLMSPIFASCLVTLGKLTVGALPTGENKIDLRN